MYVLGAGFSCHAGIALASELRSLVFDWIERNRERDSRIGPHLRPSGSWPEFPDGKFHAGLAVVDKDQGFEELLISLQATEESHPVTVQTARVLRRACVRLIWERQRSCRLSEAYLNFAARLRHSKAVISFNWDLVCERSLQEAGVTWSYDPGRALSVIKPHGSINWVNHLQGRDGRRIANPPGLLSIGDGLTISWEPSQPFDDPLLKYDSDNLRQVLFPGDPELPSTEEGTARQDALRLWRAAETAISSARRIVFIGYSLPEYDHYSRKTFERVCQGKEIVVCNPDEAVIRHFQTAFPTATIVPEAIRFEESRWVMPLGQS
jgi:hypothetical protein